jgi:hypothetical protein
MIYYFSFFKKVCYIVSMSDIVVEAQTSKRPAFRGQTVIDQQGIYKLDDENSVLVVENLLDKQALAEYLSCAVSVERKSGRSGFGVKPRQEICYSPTGDPYVYSRIKHPTKKYPDHVLTLVDTATRAVEKLVGKHPYTVIDSGVDILYDDTFPRGGSIAAHKDDEDDWGMVIVYNLGQTRYLRVRRDEDKRWYNVATKHNSLVVMFGRTFQQLYTHQVDKLSEGEPIFPRLSLNVRFKHE